MAERKPAIKRWGIFFKERSDSLVLESILRHENFRFDVQTVHGMGKYDGDTLVQVWATSANFKQYILRELDSRRFEGRSFDIQILG